MSTTTTATRPDDPAFALLTTLLASDRPAAELFATSPDSLALASHMLGNQALPHLRALAEITELRARLITAEAVITAILALRSIAKEPAQNPRHAETIRKAAASILRLHDSHHKPHKSSHPGPHDPSPSPHRSPAHDADPADTHAPPGDPAPRAHHSGSAPIPRSAAGAVKAPTHRPGHPHTLSPSLPEARGSATLCTIPPPRAPPARPRSRDGFTIPPAPARHKRKRPGRVTGPSMANQSPAQARRRRRPASRPRPASAALPGAGTRLKLSTNA